VLLNDTSGSDSLFEADRPFGETVALDEVLGASEGLRVWRVIDAFRDAERTNDIDTVSVNRSSKSDIVGDPRRWVPEAEDSDVTEAEGVRRQMVAVWDRRALTVGSIVDVIKGSRDSVATSVGLVDNGGRVTVSVSVQVNDSVECQRTTDCDLVSAYDAETAPGRRTLVRVRVMEESGKVKLWERVALDGCGVKLSVSDPATVANDGVRSGDGV
jgi:hypothetical protein